MESGSLIEITVSSPISSPGKVQNGLVSHLFKFPVLFKFPHKWQCEVSIYSKYSKPILVPVPVPVPVPFRFGDDTHGHVYVTCGRTVITTADDDRFNLVLEPWTDVTQSPRQEGISLILRLDYFPCSLFKRNHRQVKPMLEIIINGSIPNDRQAL